MGGFRAERAILMMSKPGHPNDPVPGQVLGRELGELAEGEGWIGVEPMLPGAIVTTMMGYGPVK